MKQIGHQLVRIANGEVEQEWVGDWNHCPGIPGQIRLPDGSIAEGAGPKSVITFKGKPTFKIVPVMGSPKPENVDEECGRRITAVLPITKQLNRQAAHVIGRPSAEFKEVSRIGWEWIDDMRKAARKLKGMKTIPDDFTDDDRWPPVPAELSQW